MQGIYINGQRPKSKKAIKQAILDDPASVMVEATSLFGNEFSGPVTELTGQVIFVGPDPYTKRVFYGKILARAGKITVT